jgi:hypothetical protein
MNTVTTATGNGMRNGDTVKIGDCEYWIDECTSQTTFTITRLRWYHRVLRWIHRLFK